VVQVVLGYQHAAQSIFHGLAQGWSESAGARSIANQLDWNECKEFSENLERLRADLFFFGKLLQNLRLVDAVEDEGKARGARLLAQLTTAKSISDMGKLRHNSLEFEHLVFGLTAFSSNWWWVVVNLSEASVIYDSLNEVLFAVGNHSLFVDGIVSIHDDTKFDRDEEGIVAVCTLIEGTVEGLHLLGVGGVGRQVG